jgi:hypothetical protein
MSLANGLLSDDFVYLLAEVPLRDLYPCSGPAPDFDYPDDPDDYERRVVEMMSMFEAGWDAPPLFVHLPTRRGRTGARRYCASGARPTGRSAG